MSTPPPDSDSDSGTIGLFGATAIGVGGMIGAGIFSLLGVVGAVSGSAAWLSFLVTGFLGLACGHSFARLGATFPSNGGPVEFLLRGYGNSLLSGSLNIMLWFGYVLALGLYASAFSGYAAALIGGGGGGAVPQTWMQPVISVSVVAVFLLLNVLGSAAVGKAEGVIVATKLVILLGFVGVTAFYVQPDLLSTAHWAPTSSIAFGLGTTFLAYEGFGLITNSAGDMKNPARTLPRAIYLSLAITIVIYMLIAVTAFGNIPVKQIVAKQGYALSAAAVPAMGQLGFTIMAVAALLSTASAINATLFGGANVSFTVAHNRQMPRVFDRTVWLGARGGLYITAGLVALLAALVPLGAIADTGSAAFLIIYAAVCAANLRLREQTGGAAWPAWIAIAGCVTVLGLLAVYLVQNKPGSAIGLGALVAVSVGAEYVYRRATKLAAAPDGGSQGALDK